MDYTPQLRQQMQQVGLESFKALCEAALISPSVLKRLRNGQVMRMRVDTLLKLSRALNMPLTELVEQFTVDVPLVGSVPPPQELRPAVEYLQQFQHASLQMLEPWLIQWPTAVRAVQANDQIPAARLVPLVTPVSRLVASWEVVPIGEVGQDVAYDPHIHQLMAGQAQPGDRVRIRYVGYHKGDTLLHRAKVSVVTS